MINTPILRYMRKKGLFNKRCLADTAHNATYYVVLACIMLFMLLMAICSFCDISHAQGHLEAIKAYMIEGYTPNQWCEAIRHAENSTGHPYGIMIKYKNTTPKQACLNTIIHRYKKWNHKDDFAVFLGRTYSPPDINPNWVRLVKYFLNKQKNTL